MKKLILCGLILMIMLCSLTACSGKDKKDVPSQTSDKSGQADNKASEGDVRKVDNKQDPVIKTDKEQSEQDNADKTKIDTDVKSEQEDKIPDLKAIGNETFAFIDDKGSLRFKNYKDGSEQVIISKDRVFDYDFNLKDGLLVYASIKDKSIIDSKVVLYNMKTNKKEIMDFGEPARMVKWSPNRKYIAVDYGTGPAGMTMIYDVKNKKLIKISEVATMGFVWSPVGDALAFGIWEKVSPPTPVGDGGSVSAAVIFLNDKSGAKTVMKGTNNYMSNIVKWIDSKTLIIERDFFEDSKKNTYFRVDLSNGTMKEVSKKDIGFDKESIKLPEEVSSVIYDVSSDGKRILYNFYDDKAGKQKVFILDTEGLKKTELCDGEWPKWVIKQ